MYIQDDKVCKVKNHLSYSQQYHHNAFIINSISNATITTPQ